GLEVREVPAPDRPFVPEDSVDVTAWGELNPEAAATRTFQHPVFGNLDAQQLNPSAIHSGDHFSVWTDRRQIAARSQLGDATRGKLDQASAASGPGDRRAVRGELQLAGRSRDFRRFPAPRAHGPVASVDHLELWEHSVRGDGISPACPVRVETLVEI